MIGTSPPIRFATKIALLMETRIGAEGFYPGIKSLAWQLGCRYAILGRLDSPPRIEPLNEDPVRATLLRLLRTSSTRRLSDRMAILDGLGTNDRWRACVDNEDDAYALAWLVTSIALEASADTTAQYANTFCTLLAGWTGVQFLSYPSVDEVTRAMFGEVWCDMVLVSLEPWEVCSFIASSRPALKPGLLAEHLLRTALMLPDLELA